MSRIHDDDLRQARRELRDAREPRTALGRWWKAVSSPRARERRRIIRQAERHGVDYMIPPHWRRDGRLLPGDRQRQRRRLR
jgi:hypothetical protein